MTKKILSAALCLALTLGLFAGCTQTTDEEQTPSSEGFVPALDTGISGTVNVLGNYENFEALDAAALEFQKYYPNVTISYECLDDYNTNITPRVSSDTSVGLFMINRYNFIDNDALLDCITDISTLDINFDDIDSHAVKGCYIDGKLFGIPIWFRYYGLVVNKNILEDNGLEIPSTLDELYSCCETLKSAGYIPIQQHIEIINQLFLPMAMNDIAKNLTAEEVEALLSGQEGSAEILREPIDLIFDMYDKGYADRDNVLSYEDYYNAAILKFFEGDVPFLVASTQTVSGMAKRESKSEAFTANPFEYEFIYTPTGESGPIVYKADDVGFALNKNCENFDLASEFYRFVYTEEILNLFSEVKGTPTTAAVTDNDLYVNLPDVGDENTVYFSDLNDPTNLITDVLGDVSDAIVNNEITTTDEAIALFEELAANHG